MRFRPCIDIHNGKVKQIVGGSLQDEGSYARDNFVSGQDAAYYGELYRRKGLTGGHIILLNPADSPYYEEDLRQASLALEAYPGGLQIGGGVTLDNAEQFLKMGATHVIVTSFVFWNGMIDYDRLQSLCSLVGREHLVLDLSCRRYEDGYYIVTDRWQRRTKERLSVEILKNLEQYCDEYLIHAVDVEGRAAGIELPVVEILAGYSRGNVTYAGGIHSMEDIASIEKIGGGKIHFTVGSALDLFGGNIPFDKVCGYCDR